MLWNQWFLQGRLAEGEELVQLTSLY